jgi:hypothetical protein
MYRARARECQRSREVTPACRLPILGVMHRRETGVRQAAGLARAALPRRGRDWRRMSDRAHEAGRSAWCIADATRAAVLIDGAAYFSAFAAAAARAQRSLLVLGWDVDSRIALHHEEPDLPQAPSSMPWSGAVPSSRSIFSPGTIRSCSPPSASC